MTESFSNLKKIYAGKKILVVGLGLQGGGVGMARFFSELGAAVTVTDKKNETQLAPSIQALKKYPVTFHLGGHNITDFTECDFIFKGPGVLWSSPEIKAAIDKKIPVEMEMSFFAANFPGKIIGITGTRGKSTTTNLIFRVLKAAGFPVYLGGGLPGISNIEYLKNLTENDYVVAELSSWALSGFHRKKISPHVAVFTNIFPDHLNYYRDIEEYIYDKKAIYLYQKKGDLLISNKSLDKYTGDCPSDKVTFDSTDFPYKLRFLRGVHNLENAAAALKVAEFLKVNSGKAVSVISSFSGLADRQEVVGEKNGTFFVNDTTSTTPVATVRAIESFADKPIYLILGGNSKNLPPDVLYDVLGRTEKIILLAGTFTDEILPALKEKFPEKISGPFDRLGPAVSRAFELSSKGGGYVLFSPGATSFAMFNNEFHRGAEFKRIARTIISASQQSVISNQ